MKKKLFCSLVIAFCIALNITLSHSQSAGKALMSKEASKGAYIGTYQLNNGNVSVFYQTSAGIYAYEFDVNSNFIKEHSGSDALKVLAQSTDESISLNTDGMKEVSKLDVLYAGSSWGALKLQKGTLVLKSDSDFIYGIDYKKVEDKKLKAEGTWRTALIGNRAIIPDDMKTVKFKGKNGKFMSFSFSPMGMTIMTPVSGYIQSAGIVTEKVSIANPSIYNANRLVVFKVGGNSFEETNNITIMPYAMQALGTGMSAKGNFVAMTMPLNAPSSVKEQKALVAPIEDRNNLYIYEINENNQVVSEAVHKSDLRTVNFQAVSTDEKTFIVGTGAEGKNWRMFYAGQSAMSGLTIAVQDKEGKIIGSNTYLDNDLLSKLEIAGTGKGKLQKFTGGPNFYRAEKLENGNTFIFGVSDGYHHGILLSVDNKLMKYYIFPHEDLTKHSIYSHQLEVRGNQVYLVHSDQPLSLSNAVQSSTSSRSHTSGNLKITTTTETTTQLFEIYHVSSLFTIDGTSGKSTQLWLNKIQKDFYTIGESPAIFANDAIYFTGRVKPKGQEVSLIKISY